MMILKRILYMHHCVVVLVVAVAVVVFFFLFNLCMMTSVTTSLQCARPRILMLQQQFY